MPKLKSSLPRKKTVVQCTRCQRYGHTKAYCRRQYRCVKCGDDHDTSTCTKTRDTAPKCALYGGEHPAYYRGCTIYQEITEKRNPTTRHTSIPTINDEQTDTRPRNHLPRNTLSYAEATGASASRQTDENNNNNRENTNGIVTMLEKTFQKIRTMIQQQTQLLNTMVNLLTTVLTKSS